MCGVCFFREETLSKVIAGFQLSALVVLTLAATKFIQVGRQEAAQAERHRIQQEQAVQEEHEREMTEAERELAGLMQMAVLQEAEQLPKLIPEAYRELRNRLEDVPPEFRDRATVLVEEYLKYLDALSPKAVELAGRATSGPEDLDELTALLQEISALKEQVRKPYQELERSLAVFRKE
jgi:hypothetical protein